ncbi:hypothetical protein A3195_19300 [Candidatus Thiodiazotropha endoloripes]|uniref:DUF2202 domain-containing protein n=1 Tax=Candidatus Thiodiazotropha endoloripes TaxID=1818881 RepID=UPI00083DE209|nr:DUF2202 domain-containing protein [Candidatus Thiodiazotropha endoloripes]ODB82966.1 hypothetical protein A3195_19300 [Candidatus Thiodiazotropha endoloripes]
MVRNISLLVVLSVLTLSEVQAGWGNGGGQGQIAESLTTVEAEHLQWLREEEKVSRDVYDLLYQHWGLYVFSNIAAAEQRHMDSVLMQLQRYGLVDPALQAGLFSNQELQALYESLMLQGTTSEMDALHTGALIEEVDMQDLHEMIASTDNSGLISLYEKLLCGSRNHLRAFVSQIESRGMVYQAQVMDQEAVDLIVDSPMERRCGRRYR